MRPDPVIGFMTSMEWDACKLRAQEVQAVDREAKVTDRLVTRRDSVLNQACGFAAEIVVARYLDALPDMSTDVGLIRKFDIVHHGWRIDVKWSPGPRISIAGHVDRSRCDIYAAVQGKPPLFLQMNGWHFAWLLQSPQFWNEKAPRPCWQASPDDLVGMDALLRIGRKP